MKKALAIDIGGTKIHGAIFDETGKILLEHEVPTDAQRGAKEVLKSINQLIDELKAQIKPNVIGIGIPGRINVAKGSFYYPPNNIPGFEKISIRKVLEKKHHIPVIVDNDVNVAGLGEEWMGAAKGRNSYVLVALGTGIGGAVKVDGVRLHGAHWSATEIGHMTLYPHGRQCNCGMIGCFEQYCSGPALVRGYNELNPDHPIKAGYDFFPLIDAKDPIAIKVLAKFVDDLKVGLNNLMNAYDPEAFLIGGGLINTKKYWWDELIKALKASPMADIYMPKILPTKLGNNSCIYGAAYLGFEYLKTKPKVTE